MSDNAHPLRNAESLTLELFMGTKHQLLNAHLMISFQVRSTLDKRVFYSALSKLNT